MAFLNKKRSHAKAKHLQRGVGMIEVLISITITAFALLGLAGLQMAALKYQKVAHFRSVASQLGADMADRVRANATSVTTTVGTNAVTYVTTDKYSPTPPSDVPSCANNSGTACATPQDIVNKDIYEWRAALSRALAGGWGTVSAYNATPGPNQGVTVTVYYNEPDRALASVLDSDCDSSVFPAGVEQSQMRCFKTTVMP
ncbi:type IV pilus modification protein PilV [Collimonas arenae]|uniref:Type IV pilus modification protein PilV n=1 Tax=Collimonas arenae TaxID=279058 RepID=A0A127QNZ4_9BURK|nr:type IV pilus modification protein PilV [Collimonas arenae]AMP01412.1 type IV pilus modification protein PilV [Collimonas arenae]AMP11312.1 type IV pilus modification protein PilV [Collimonas arenae]